MTDDEYIRKAVELAEAWRWHDDEDCPFIVGPFPLMDEPANEASQIVLDALAAQLVRQVDALGGDQWVLESHYRRSCVTECDLYGMPKYEFHGRGPDRTMNTIRAIVDSGVLTEQDKGE